MAFDPSKSSFNVQVYGKQTVKQGRKIINYGLSGSGKTTFGASGENPIFIDTDFGENEYLVAHAIPYWSPNKSDYYGSIMSFLKACLNKTDIFDSDGGPMADRKTIVIDTWTKLNRALLEEAARQNPKVGDLARNKATFSEWGFLGSRQFAIMDILTSICEVRGMDVIITAQPTVIGDEMEEAKKSDSSEDGYSNVLGLPALVGGYKRSFGADACDVYYMERLSTPTFMNRIWTVPHNSYFAKSRRGLPASIDMPDMAKLNGLAKI